MCLVENRSWPGEKTTSFAKQKRFKSFSFGGNRSCPGEKPHLFFQLNWSWLQLRLDSSWIVMSVETGEPGGKPHSQKSKRPKTVELEPAVEMTPRSGLSSEVVTKFARLRLEKCVESGFFSHSPSPRFSHLGIHRRHGGARRQTREVESARIRSSLFAFEITRAIGLFWPRGWEFMATWIRSWGVRGS